MRWCKGYYSARVATIVGFLLVWQLGFMVGIGRHHLLSGKHGGHDSLSGLRRVKTKLSRYMPDMPNMPSLGVGSLKGVLAGKSKHAGRTKGNSSPRGPPAPPLTHAEWLATVGSTDYTNLDQPDNRPLSCNQPYPLPRSPFASPELMTASVIISFRNETLRALERTIASLLRHTSPDLLAEIIMVDDNNVEGAIPPTNGRTKRERTDGRN